MVSSTGLALRIRLGDPVAPVVAAHPLGPVQSGGVASERISIFLWFGMIDGLPAREYFPGIHRIVDSSVRAFSFCGSHLGELFRFQTPVVLGWRLPVCRGMPALCSRPRANTSSPSRNPLTPGTSSLRQEIRCVE